MTHTDSPDRQEASGTRRETKRQRRRSEFASPTDAVTTLQPQRAAWQNVQMDSHLTGIRTRSSFVAEGQQRHDQHSQQQEPVQSKRVSARRLRKQLTSPEASHERGSEALGRTKNCTACPDACLTKEHGGCPQNIRATRKGDTTARAPMRQCRRRRGCREVSGTDRPWVKLDEIPDPLCPSNGHVSNEQPIEPSSSSAQSNCPRSTLTRPWALDDLRGRQLLQLLSKARIAYMEQLLTCNKTSELSVETPRSFLTEQKGSGDEPIACVQSPWEACSSIRIFSGAASLSQQHVTALSQAAAG